MLHASRPHPLFGLLLLSVLLLFIMVQINVIALAFAEIGIPSEYVFTALFVILLGSMINIPVKRIPQQSVHTEVRVSVFGLRQLFPVVHRKETVLAVNLGGAVIPVLLCLYLLIKTGVWVSALAATIFMVIVTYRLARPVRGVGITLPALVPPVLAAVISVLVAYKYAPVVAYISGTLGSLIGADLLNLNKIRNLGAATASIGGAGTFDGIFMNGILAVLLAAVLA